MFFQHTRNNQKCLMKKKKRLKYERQQDRPGVKKDKGGGERERERERERMNIIMWLCFHCNLLDNTEPPPTAKST